LSNSKEKVDQIIGLQFDDGFFTIQTQDRHLIVSYWTPIDLILKHIFHSSDTAHVRIVVDDGKTKIDDKTSIGSALSNAKMIKIESKQESLLLTSEKSFSRLIDWKINQKLDHAITLEVNAEHNCEIT